MADSVWILGTAMTNFGRHPDKDVIDLGARAALDAFDDGGVTIHDMQTLAVGCLFSPNMIGQRLQKQIGQTGIPVHSVVNACATGGAAARTVYLSIKAGECDMGLAVGMEQMGKMGLLGVGAPPTGEKVFEPSGRLGVVGPVEGVVGGHTMPTWFALAAQEYAHRHGGVGFEQFAKVAEKNHAHSTLNPLAQYQKRFTLDEIMNAEMISYPNTLPMCSPTGDGAAAAVLVSERKLRTLDPDQQRRAVKISASAQTSDPYVDGNHVQHDVFTVSRNAADLAYEQAGIGPEDLDLVELHDCFASAELIHYDSLRLCEEGGAGDFIDTGAPWRNGKIPVSVSGGLLSKGHPIGATGIANLYEVTTHLRGEAGDRQVPGAKVGLTHVLGGGWTAIVHILEAPATKR